MSLPATCYARFSSLEQATGNSLARQFDLAKEVCERNGWLYDPDRCVSDEGVSAFTGANRVEGSALFGFQRQAERGLFRNGHVLVVEHLDRISRQGFEDVFAFLNNLCAQGVTIATHDGWRVYEPYQRIPMPSIMEVLIKSEMSREESANKRKRQLDNWERKLNQVRSGDRTAITKLVPEWIDVDPKTREMTANPYRAGIVEEVFRLSVEGYGSPAIANMFNARGEETWAVHSKDDKKGRYKAGDKRAKRGWTISYINRMLTNPAVMGEYQPMMRARSDVLATARGERYLDYYPRVIDPATFAQAQAARGRRQQSGGKLWAQQVNLFSGIARCEVCGDKMGYVGTRRAGTTVKGTSGARKPITYVVGEDINYLQCNSARRNYRCSNRKRIRYEHLERAVLDNILHLALDDTHFEVADQSAELAVQVADQERRVVEMRERLSRLVDSFSRTGSPSIEKAVLLLEREVADAERLLAGLREQHVAALGSVSAEEHQRRIAEVRTLLGDSDRSVRLEARRRVHQALKQIATITCSPEQVSTVTLANGLAAFRVSMSSELLDQFNLSNRLDLHRGLTTGGLAGNAAILEAVVRRSGA